MIAGLGNLPGGSDPNKSAAQPNTGPINNRTGQDYNPFEKGTQGPGSPLRIPVDEYDGDDSEDDTSSKPSPVDTTQGQTGGDRNFFRDLLSDYMGFQERQDDPERLLKKLETLEPFLLRRAQVNQKMGLENLEAAGKAAFNYKYAPQMFMTAAASRAAYYPEMVRAASESYTGLNLANAAKPRMSGYYRGVV